MRSLAAALILSLATAAGAGAQTRPNIVVILADDLGFATSARSTPPGA